MYKIPSTKLKSYTSKIVEEIESTKYKEDSRLVVY